MGSSAYEDEQAKLRAEYEGTSDGIQISAPEEPEVDPKVYVDVEALLFRGFLTVSAKINEVRFVFKNLNHHELAMIKMVTDFEEDKNANDIWDAFLAYGVLMVDGTNVLVDRHQAIPKLIDTFKDFNKSSKVSIIRYLGEINRRASNAVTLTEAYSMEKVSRHRWLQQKGLDPTAVAVTGFDGTQFLGMNWAQHLWRAINQVEDRNEEHEREWENAKFVGSCFAGKSVNKVYRQDQERRQKARQERLDRKDELLREIVLGEKPTNITTSEFGTLVVAPKTIKELATQLQNDLNGNKDWHDRVVEEHENRLRNAYQERVKQVEELNKQQTARGIGVSSSTEHGFSRDQVEQKLLSKKQRQALAAARMQERPDLLGDEKATNAVEKWINKPEKK